MRKTNYSELIERKISEDDVYKLLEPSRNKDVSDVLCDMVWHVCYQFLMYKKPVFNPRTDINLPDNATKEEIGNQYISFLPLAVADYSTVGSFMKGVVIEEAWCNEEGLLLQTPQRRSRLVSEGFNARAPVKTYVEKRLGVASTINGVDDDWLVTMAKQSAVFRHWWLEITSELLMRLERLPMETALAWQGISASKAIQEQSHRIRLLNQKTREDITNAKKEAGESLVSWVERQVGGENRYYDATNEHHLYATLECLANAFGKRRIAAALVNVPIYGTTEVKEGLIKAYPFTESE